MHIEIKRLSNSDDSYNILLSYLYEVDELFPIPLHKQGAIEDLAKKWLSKAIVLIALETDTNEVCGSIIAYANDNENHIAFTAIKVVSKSYQRKGVMKLLRQQMTILAKESGMLVLRENIHESNAASIFEIKKSGGKQIGNINDRFNIHNGDLLFEIAL